MSTKQRRALEALEEIRDRSNRDGPLWVFALSERTLNWLYLNARLIAAAPTMLERIENLEAYLYGLVQSPGDVPDPDDLRTEYEATRDLVNKAKGE